MTRRFLVARGCVALALFMAAYGIGSNARAQVQTDKIIRVSGFVLNASYCEATFTRNPALAWIVDNVNIKIGGPLPTVIDPGYWYVNSPTVIMPAGTTGVYVELYENGVPTIGYHESNTVAHDGPFSAGTWTVGLRLQPGANCADYDDHVHVTFTLE